MSAEAGEAVEEGGELRSLPLLSGVAAALVLAALLARLFTTGGGIELFQPGTQILFDLLVLCAASVLALARWLGKAEWRSNLVATLPLFALVLALSAAASAHSDLAWRSALSWFCLPLLALTLRELARDERLRLVLPAWLLAAVALGAALGVYEYTVEIPALQAEYRGGALEGQLAHLERGQRIALHERILSRAATGPYLLPGLLACACCMVLPLLSVLAFRARGRTLAGLASGLAWVLVLAGLLLSKSKGGLVTGAGTAGLLILLHPALEARRPLLLKLAGVAFGLLFLGGLGIFVAGPERIGVGLSLTVRLEYWSAALELWQERPWRGVGLNAFREHFARVKSLRAEEALHAHNGYLQVLAEQGLLGALGLLTGLLAFLRSEWKAVPADPSDPPGSLLPSGPPWVLGGALVLGLALLAGHGDAYNAGRLGHLLAVGAALPFLAWGLKRAFERSDPALLRAGALAGAGALLFDAGLNFGLHHAGVSVVGWSLLGLAPALGRVAAPSSLPPLLSRGLLGGVLALTLGLTLFVLPDALAADQARGRGQAAHERAAQAGGRRVEAKAALGEALAGLSEASERYPAHAHTWLQLANAFQVAAGLSEEPAQAEIFRELAREASVEAIKHNPVAASAYASQAELLSEQGLLEPAAAAWERALTRYPGHPGYLLAAGELRLRRAPRDPRALEEAQDFARRALEASETTRLVRLRLTTEEVGRAKVLLGAAPKER